MQTIAHPSAPVAEPSINAAPDGFMRVEGGATEQITETTSLVAAYSAIWLILMAVLLVTFRASRSLRAHAERADEAVRQLSHTPL
jgi:hypothetical protein